MTPPTLSSLVPAVALLASALALVAIRVRLGRPLPAPFAEPRASAAPGERWALTAAFLPWNKESARHHAPSCAAGLLVRAAVATMLARLLWSLTGRPLPRPVELALALALAAGLAACLEPRAIPAFQWIGAAMALSAPLGKLRHMVFLVTSRRFWGRFFGRRGVKPAPHIPGQARQG